MICRAVEAAAQPPTPYGRTRRLLWDLQHDPASYSPFFSKARQACLDWAGKILNTCHPSVSLRPCLVVSSTYQLLNIQDGRHSFACRSYPRFTHTLVIVTSSGSSLSWIPAFDKTSSTNPVSQLPEVPIPIHLYQQSSCVPPQLSHYLVLDLHLQALCKRKISSLSQSRAMVRYPPQPFCGYEY